MTDFQKVAETLKLKKSDEYCARKLNMTLENYQSIKRTLKKLQQEEVELEQFLGNEEGQFFTEDLVNNTAEYKIKTDHCPRSSQEIEELVKLDKTKWKILKYSMRNGSKPDVWLLTIQVGPVKGIEDKFQSFLSDYKPCSTKIQNVNKNKKENTCLIINKQDSHLNKFDVHGDNSIKDRFDNILDKTKAILDKATLHSNLEQIVYILGSDLLDSEWTEMTTKGTPQKSILPYQESFEEVCNHEISQINLLLSYTDSVIIPFVSGNHDEYSGWHLVSWLKAYYRNDPKVNINTDKEYTKYLKYGNSAFMLNHGDAMKPEKLAQIFPLDYKKEWSNCDYFNILTGDRHHEITRDIGGIRFYQVPAWSKSNSKWDIKHGWTMVKGEIQAFHVTETRGITNIYKEPL